MSDHMKKYWEKEIQDMRNAVIDGRFEISIHAKDKRMNERDISITEMGAAIMTGKIQEGWDIGTYPKCRNQDPLRTIIGKTTDGEVITLGVAIKSNGYKITTVYRGVTRRLKGDFLE